MDTIRKSITYAREATQVDAQSLLQRALNEVYGNPRELEDKEQWNAAKRLWRVQRLELAKRVNMTVRTLKRRLFEDNTLDIRDLAAALHVLGYELELTIKKSDLDSNDFNCAVS